MVRGRERVVGLHQRHIESELPPALPPRCLIPRDPQKPTACLVNLPCDTAHRPLIALGDAFVHPVEAPELKMPVTGRLETLLRLGEVPAHNRAAPGLCGKILALAIPIDIPEILHGAMQVGDREHDLSSRRRRSEFARHLLSRRIQRRRNKQSWVRCVER